MFANKTLRAAVVKTPIGPIQFPKANWNGKGAVFWSMKNRTAFQIKFWTFAIIGLGLPFFSFERKVWSQRFKGLRGSE